MISLHKNHLFLKYNLSSRERPIQYVQILFAALVLNLISLTSKYFSRQYKVFSGKS